MAFRDNRQDDIFKCDPIPWTVSREISHHFLAERVVSPYGEAEVIACGQANAIHFPNAPGVQWSHVTKLKTKNSRNKHTKGSACYGAGRQGRALCYRR